MLGVILENGVITVWSSGAAVSRWFLMGSSLSVAHAAEGSITAQQMVAQSRQGSVWCAANPSEKRAAIKEPSASHILHPHIWNIYA